MEFVVEVLMRFFQKDITQARHIMLHVHHKGYGIVDTFPRDVAETKAEQDARDADCLERLGCAPSPRSEEHSRTQDHAAWMMTAHPVVAYAKVSAAVWWSKPESTGSVGGFRPGVKEE